MDYPLHVVSFNVPWPPDYGGVMDVFYKVKALAEEGIRIRLHCFQYGREQAPELNRYCEKVYYYSRRSPFFSMAGMLPYIVGSRASVDLLNNLLLDRAPIIFEGLHSCFYLSDRQLSNRMKAVRLHNVEWQYYKGLADYEPNPIKEWYYAIESFRLKKYEKIVKKAEVVFPISASDKSYYESEDQQVIYLPAFHPHSEVSGMTGRGEYCLYHGNLGVRENIRAAVFLMRDVFAGMDIKLVVAGQNPSDEISHLASENRNIEVISNPDNRFLDKLIREAQINVLPTFQGTGIKLKLLNALFLGRHCLVNNTMVEGTGLEPHCIECESPEDWRAKIIEYMKVDFSEEQILKRKQFEFEFSNRQNASSIIQTLYAQSLPQPDHPNI